MKPPFNREEDMLVHLSPNIDSKQIQAAWGFQNSVKVRQMRLLRGWPTKKIVLPALPGLPDQPDRCARNIVFTYLSK